MSLLRTLLYYLTGCDRFKHHSDTLPHQGDESTPSPRDEEEAIGLPPSPSKSAEHVDVNNGYPEYNGPYVPPDGRMHSASNRNGCYEKRPCPAPALAKPSTHDGAEDKSSNDFSTNQARGAQGSLRLYPATLEEDMWYRNVPVGEVCHLFKITYRAALTSSYQSQDAHHLPSSSPDPTTSADQTEHPRTHTSLLLEKQTQLARLAAELAARQSDRATYLRSVQTTKESLRAVRREVRTLKRVMKIEEVMYAHLDAFAGGPRRNMYRTRPLRKLLCESGEADFPPPRVHYRDDVDWTVDPELIASLVARM